MKRTYISLLGAFVAFAAFLFGAFPALAQVAVAPNLGSAAPFAVLGANALPTLGTVTCTDTGPGIGITGQVGTTFLGGITNVGPCAITGPIVAPVGGAVVTDFNAAFTSIDTLNPLCTGAIPIVTTTLAPGVYCSAAGTTIPVGVTLTLNGTASDVWVFRVGTAGVGALTVNSGQVVMGGAALACNVFWKTSAAMTVTDSASFVGTVLSGDAATMTRTNWTGRMLATTDVTLTDPEPMTFAGCAPAPPPPPPSGLTCPPVGALTAGGAGVTETVTLASPAPAGGTIVTLTSSAPGTASVPFSVVVPAGSTSVSFTITPGLTPGSATITATTGGGSVICTVAVGAGIFLGGAGGGPTLDPLGLSILVLLLAAAGVLLVNRMRM